MPPSASCFLTTLRWNTPERVHFCLDNAVPLGSSQHQKLIVIDDALAFSGGLDVTIRRWDTTAHRLEDPLRVDTVGKPYRPFHDVQAVVDGAAARALAELARARWTGASCDPVPSILPCGDPWPDDVAVDFTRVAVGIARTQPFYEEQREVREVERLYLDMIDSAEQAIYIENQFLTSTKVAHRLARRLQARPALEALIVCPKGHDAWLESHSMRYGRIRFQQVLRDAGVGGRVRLVYPSVTNGERAIDTMVHSKLMIADDRILRIGSANLNNRSMGTDTECDLAIVAGSDEERRQIAHIRARLLGDHCGVSANEAAAAIAANASLLTTAERLGANGHSRRFHPGWRADLQERPRLLQSVADPERPIGAEEFVSQMFGGHVRPRQVPTVLRLVAVAVVVLALTLVWQYTPLAGVANPERIREALAAFADGPWGPVVTVTAFVAGGLLAFPLTILIVATAAAFGPWAGCAYAAVGAMTSAVVTYGLGAWLGKESLRKVLGPKLNRVRDKIARQGVIAIAAACMVPIAPFTVVNLVAGASEIGLSTMGARPRSALRQAFWSCPRSATR